MPVEAAEIAKHLSTQYGIVGVLITVLVASMAGMAYFIWWMSGRQERANKEARDEFIAELKGTRAEYIGENKAARDQMQLIVNQILASASNTAEAIGEFAKELALQRERCQRGERQTQATYMEPPTPTSLPTRQPPPRGK